MAFGEPVPRTDPARRVLREAWPAAAEEAGRAVRLALVALVRVGPGLPPRMPDLASADLESIQTLLLRKQGRGAIPPTVCRHLTRITTWHSDLRLGPLALKKREV